MTTAVSAFAVIPRQPKIDDNQVAKKESLHKAFLKSESANDADKFFYGEGKLGWLGIVLDVVLIGIPIGIVKIKEMMYESEYGKEVKADELVRKRGLDKTDGEGKILYDKIMNLDFKKVEELEEVEPKLRSAISSNQRLLFAPGSQNEQTRLITDPDTMAGVYVQNGALYEGKEDTPIMSRQDFLFIASIIS